MIKLYPKQYVFTRIIKEQKANLKLLKTIKKERINRQSYLPVDLFVIKFLLKQP